jgi:curved DNA-binding protein
MEFKDYYAILGVAPDADEQAIKRAYRALAREHHPDVNPGDKRAEERFKEINEAYQALSDPERRKKYDELRRQYQQWQQRGGPRQDFRWSDWEAAPGQRVHVQSVSPEDLEDMFGGDAAFSEFFSSIFGQAGPRAGRAARPRRGRDLELPVEITLDEAFHGTTRTIQVGDRTIEARIPPGVRDGARVRLAGQGSPGAAGGAPGDLYLLVEVAPHPRFERDGDDLTCDVDVDIFTAAAGGEVRVPTLDGVVRLKIPPRTQAGKTFRLRGKGMPRPGKPSERGDLYARARLVLPEPLSDDEVRTLRDLAARRTAKETV